MSKLFAEISMSLADTTLSFVTGGPQAALALAREAAGDRDGLFDGVQVPLRGEVAPLRYSSSSSSPA